MDGVRRAKAYQLSGRRKIAARLVDIETGLMGGITMVWIRDLRSPKEFMFVSDEVGWERWRRIIDGIREGDMLPSIEIQPGEGMTINDVGLD